MVAPLPPLPLLPMPAVTRTPAPAAAAVVTRVRPPAPAGAPPPPAPALAAGAPSAAAVVTPPPAVPVGGPLPHPLTASLLPAGAPAAAVAPPPPPPVPPQAAAAAYNPPREYHPPPSVASAAAPLPVPAAGRPADGAAAQRMFALTPSSPSAGVEAPAPATLAAGLTVPPAAAAAGDDEEDGEQVHGGPGAVAAAPVVHPSPGAAAVAAAPDATAVAAAPDGTAAHAGAGASDPTGAAADADDDAGGAEEPLEDTSPDIKVASSATNGRFTGVVLESQPEGCDHNITRLSYMVYKLIQSVEVHSVIVMPCRTTALWMPAVVTHLEFETPGGLNVTCVDTTPEVSQTRLINAFNDTGAAIVNGTLETIPSLPKAQMVVSWYGFQEWGVRGSWDFLGAIKQHGVDWVAFNNHGTATNGEAPGGRKAINVRKAPYHLGAPARVVKGVSLAPDSDLSLVLYDTSNMREGM